MKIILLNGPFSSGKDTAMKVIMDNYVNWQAWPHRCLRMSAPIKEAFAAMMEYKLNKYGDIEGMTQQHKEQINPTLGCSPRQWQIDFSEHFMKPLYGDNVFARLWLHRAAQLPSDTVVIVPDCGFDIELKVLIAYAEYADELHTPHHVFSIDEIFLIRLYRKGCELIPGTRQFRDDSREYVSDDRIRSVDLINEDKNVFEATIIRQVTPFLQGQP